MAFTTRSWAPAMIGCDWWDSWDYPLRISDQHFGSGLLENDLLPPTFYRGYILRPRTRANIAGSGQSEVVSDKDKFQIMLNVSQFASNELDIKTVDNYVIIHAKHEEKSDEHGFVSREFTRKYMLPLGVKPEAVSSSLNQNGLLTIQAPKKVVEPPPQTERNVPISME